MQHEAQESVAYLYFVGPKNETRGDFLSWTVLLSREFTMLMGIEIPVFLEYEPQQRARVFLAHVNMGSFVHDAKVALLSSGFTAASLLALVKAWIDARSGRRLKIKVGDVEVEATQMKQEDVLRLFELLEEKADRQKIRQFLLEANNQSPPKRF